MSQIAITKLSVTFGTQTVLNGIDLEIEKGEIFAVMGSSGGGKTTLLRAMTGLQPISNGDIAIAGHSIKNETRLARSKMGMVFQSAALFDSLSVWQNVRFGLERLQSHLGNAEIDKRCQNALAQVGLENEGAKMPSELSGGMRKRVGIARAIVLAPEILLYDEPITGLDPVTGFSIDELIRHVNKEFDCTSVVVSHDLNSVLRTADRIGFLADGELAYVGDTAGFLKCENEAVQGYLQKATAKTLTFSA